MKPGDPISPKKLGWLHKLFGEMGKDAEEVVRDEIEALTGSRSTKSLNEAQAWEFLQGLFGYMGRNNGFPIVVAWCPVYQPGRAKLGAGNASSLPSQKQVWRLWHLFREAGVRSPAGFLEKRFGMKDGQIRRAEEVGRVVPALTAMKYRSARDGGRREIGRRQ